MPQHELLNNIDHRDLKIITDRSAHFGDNIMCTLAYPCEFRHLQMHYPIVFHRAIDSEEHQPVVLLGLEQDENLFLTENGWDAEYLPLIMQRDPFLIGKASNTVADAEASLVIHVDMSSPRVNKEKGESVFLAQGGNTPYIEHIASVLKAIHFGHQESKALVAALHKYQLLESFVVDIELSKERNHRLSGFSTINETRLAALDGNALAELHSQGFLSLIYGVLFSMAQLSSLVKRKKMRL